jgi:hypothetical protein
MVPLTANLQLTTQFRDWLPDVDAVNNQAFAGRSRRAGGGQTYGRLT